LLKVKFITWIIYILRWSFRLPRSSCGSDWWFELRNLSSKKNYENLYDEK